MGWNGGEAGAIQLLYLIIIQARAVGQGKGIPLE